jgi:PII-like signaling protein
MMADPAEIELLRTRDMVKYANPDGPTFELLVERLKSAGLEGEAVYEAIVDNSYRTDAELNRKLGL